MVIWEDFREPTRTRYGQVLDSAFMPLGPNSRISEVTGTDQRHPALDACRRGFVVVWNESHGTQSCVWGRRFAPDGTALGPSFPVFLQAMMNPECAMDTNGNTWVVAERSGDGRNEVSLSLLDPQGQVPIGPVAISDSGVVAYSRCPSVSTLADRSRALITWIDWRADVKVRVQLVDSVGRKLGGANSISN